MRGGKREGAGRKPKADEDRIRTLSINSLVSTFGSEEKAFEHIAGLAKDSFPHLKLFDFILENQELIWQHVYESDLKKEELSNLYINNVLSSMSKNNLNQFKDRITFEIEGDKVNIKKYGGSWGSTAIFAQYPQNYLAVIDLKDNKYRVTVKNIKTDYRRAKQGFSDLAITVTKKRKTQFKDAKSVTMGLSYIDKHFLNKFDMKKIKKEADGW